MTVCGVCGYQEFDLYDGKYYCRECSTQTVEREQVIEDTDGIGFHGRQVTTSHQSFTVENFESWLTVEAFNIILKKQVEALINLGSAGNLMHTVLQLWAKYLKNCEMAFVTNDQDWFPKLSTIPRYRDYEILSENILLSGDSCCERNEAPWQTVRVNNKREYYHVQRKRKPAPEIRPFTRRKKLQSTKEADISEIIESTLNYTSSPNENIQTEEYATDDEEYDDSTFINNFSQFAKNKMGNMSEKRRKSYWNCRHNANSVDSLMLLHTICFCYAGILINHDHITLSDILRWIHNNKIPYSNAWTVLPKNMLPQKSDFRIFMTSVIPSQNKISQMTWKILKFVGIQSVPSKSLEMLVLRMILELNLPLILVKCVHQLVYKGPKTIEEMFTRDLICDQNDTFKSYNEKNKELRVLSLCIVVIKIIFGLDGQREEKMSKAACLANKELQKYFVFQDWLESVRLRFNFIQTVHPTQFRFDNLKPVACVDVDSFRNYGWKMLPIKEENIQYVYFFKGKIVNKRRHSKTEISDVKLEKPSEVSSEEEGVSIKKRKKRTNTSKVDVNINLRKILTNLIEDSARNVNKATSFPLTAALNHHFLNNHPDSLMKQDFSHFEILTIDSETIDLEYWKLKINASKLDFKENYAKLPESFRTICDYSCALFNYSHFELCKALKEIESSLAKWKF